MTNQYPLPVIEDIIAAVVDSIRKTGDITDVVFSSGISTITSINTLKEREVVAIGELEGKIKNVSSAEFQIEGDATGELTWKALAPYFVDDHFRAVANRLATKDVSVGPEKFKKYPLIVLGQDFKMAKLDGPMARAPLNFVIIHDTLNEYSPVERREFNFTPILDPLYAEFMKALNTFLGVDVLSKEWGVWRRYNWGSDFVDAHIFNDYLDAIEINDLEIETNITC